MITNKDRQMAEGTKGMIKDSILDTNLKSDLCEEIDDAVANLNGRTIEERVEGIARSQFTTLRLLVNILCDKYNKEKSWKDVIIETKWAWLLLGTVITICSIFNPQICTLISNLFN